MYLNLLYENGIKKKKILIILQPKNLLKDRNFQYRFNF